MRKINKETGATLVVSMVVLLVLTMFGTLVLTNTKMQQKLSTAHDILGMSFEAAESAIEGVISEQRDPDVSLADKVLVKARGGTVFDPAITGSMDCDDTGWIRGAPVAAGAFQTEASVDSWSQTAYMGEDLSMRLGQSTDRVAQYFNVRGCGTIDGSQTVTVNEQRIYIYGASSTK